MAQRRKKPELPADLEALAESMEDLREGDVSQEIESRELEREGLIRDAFELVASTVQGIEVLRRIMETTGYQSALCHKSATGFDTNGSLYNVARRDLWVELRAYLSSSRLREIENPTGE